MRIRNEWQRSNDGPRVTSNAWGVPGTWSMRSSGGRNPKKLPVAARVVVAGGAAPASAEGGASVGGGVGGCVYSERVGSDEEACQRLTRTTGQAREWKESEERAQEQRALRARE